MKTIDIKKYRETGEREAPPAPPRAETRNVLVRILAWIFGVTGALAFIVFLWALYRVLR